MASELGNPFGRALRLTTADGDEVKLQVMDWGLHVDTPDTSEGLDLPKLQPDPDDPDVRWIGGVKFRRAPD